MDNKPLEYRVVTDEDRSKTLEKLADEIAHWDQPRSSSFSKRKAGPWAVRRKRPEVALSYLRMQQAAPTIHQKYSQYPYRDVAQRPDAAIVVTPEGYGKSFLVVHLIKNGFKVVFCAKSNAQLAARLNDITDKWVKKPEFQKILGRVPVVERYQSKIQHLQAALAEVGIEPTEFRIVSHEKESPYAIATVNEGATVEQLAKLFTEKGLSIDAPTFFGENYRSHLAPDVDGINADVVLVSFAAFQSFCQSEREPWWAKLGLFEYRQKYVEGEDEPVNIRYPFDRIAVLIDDPDRDDVDWLRRVSDEAAELLSQRRSKISKSKLAEESPAYWLKKFNNPVFAELLAKGSGKRNERIRNTPIHKIVEKIDGRYEERPIETMVGYQFFYRWKSDPSNGVRRRPKIIVTTTEMLTARYAYHTLVRSGLKVVPRVDVFRTIDCDVTAISTTITRKANQAVLLPIVELLKQEFPEEKVTLIADGLNCQFNLSTNKGRNDLDECTTVIKLSWLHPVAIGTAMAHQEDPDKSGIGEDIIDIVAHCGHGRRGFNDVTPALMADLANQAIGRNQGFRYRGRQAILLVDPRWYGSVLPQLRYKLNPWSDLLPAFNKATSKKSALEAIQMSAGQSRLEKRLIELIHGFREFGLSAEAKRLAEGLPDRQQTFFAKWLEEQNAPAVLAKEAETKLQRRKENTEAVRRCRERKKASAIS